MRWHHGRASCYIREIRSFQVDRVHLLRSTTQLVSDYATHSSKIAHDVYFPEMDVRNSPLLESQHETCRRIDRWLDQRVIAGETAKYQNVLTNNRRCGATTFYSASSHTSRTAHTNTLHSPRFFVRRIVSEGHADWTPILGIDSTFLAFRPRTVLECELRPSQSTEKEACVSVTSQTSISAVGSCVSSLRSSSAAATIRRVD